MSQTKLKPMPHFASDEEAERFVDEADLSEYDFSGFKPMQMTKLSANSLYSMSMSSKLLCRVDDKARKLGISIDQYLLGLIQKDLAEE